MSPRRLDVALAAAGLARSRTHARRIVEEGRARIDGRPATKVSEPVAEHAHLEVVAVPDGVEYASRAAHKLRSALDLAPLPIRGARCLDAGASTGGFTDVLLREGAAEVLAVDIGHDQLAAHVREDTRVRVHDGTSIRDLTPALLGGPVDLVVADLSFISLRTVIDALAGVVRPGESCCSWSSPSSRWAVRRCPAAASSPTPSPTIAPSPGWSRPPPRPGSPCGPSTPAACPVRTATVSSSSICAPRPPPARSPPRPVT